VVKCGKEQVWQYGLWQYGSSMIECEDGQPMSAGKFERLCGYKGGTWKQSVYVVTVGHMMTVDKLMKQRSQQGQATGV